MIPDSFVGAFSKGEILQVLLLAILIGLAMVALDRDKYLTIVASLIACTVITDRLCCGVFLGT